MSTCFWIVGTDTDVGKTVVTTYLMRHFQTKGDVIPYKPVQTGIIEEEGTSYYGDTHFYQSFSEKELKERDINSYSFKIPASPHYAARLEGATIDEKHILQHIERLKAQYDYVICEGAGGLFVPLDEKRDYYFCHLIKETQMPVVLVTRTVLGTINHTLLTVEALREKGIPIAGIVCNAFEGTELEEDNIKTIRQTTGLPLLLIPKLQNIVDLKELQLEDTDEFFERLRSV